MSDTSKITNIVDAINTEEGATMKGEFYKIAEEVKSYSSTIEFYGNEYSVKRYIGFEDMMRVVDSVVKLCFHGSGEYMPEIREFAIRSCVIDAYTNIDIEPDISVRYAILMGGTNLYEMVSEKIGATQLESIINAIDKKIEYVVASNIEAISAQMDELYGKMSSLYEYVNTMFSGVNPDDVSRLMSSLSENGIDEGKFVQAYFDEINREKTE